ncbi:Carboxypeptidase regulatory-like domain-containing protein [Bryocella elongata]|uniref:Carboxypeptidase regulatory-like domain-containing protein n=1 Tax=Bryocella elongata TaxID=863522 RepID=A0A1H6B425_9BACT|nr:carboxypeptidase regulatory-like domain-containing protein [Bryocella elongata]SEG55284.1 Carboxypeptidase regulatory-like domain-containing protein [Bryocella elongata]
MVDRIRKSVVCSFALATLLLFMTATAALAQTTLGGITGTVSDPQGSVVPGVSVTAVSKETGLQRTAVSNAEGTYALVNLPIGTYTLTFTRDGFAPEKYPGIAVSADRTQSVPVSLKVGGSTESVEVDFQPLVNAVDTTNGYGLDKAQISNIPLPTGSVFGAAILTPGVNAELPSGTGALSGLGNPPIWANGQRDTSNSFSLNGVDASNLFNGKSTSNVGSARVINSTGASTSGGGGGVIQSSASVYLSIGNAIPTPAPETVEEMHVNASMYDAQQGSTSGAHIEVNTATGTNAYHFSGYGRRGTDAMNAAPFFFKNDPGIPAALKVPELHRYIVGGTAGGPIIKDKLFGFVSYQHLHVSDQEIGDSFLAVPIGLSDTTRTASGFAGLVNDPNSFGTSLGAGDIDRTALGLFNSPSLPGEPGKWLIPNATSTPTYQHPFSAFLPGTGRFKADLAVANLDYNMTKKDTLALKYYYQHDPTLAPYAYSSVPGFTEHLDSGAQVVSITNTYLVKSNLSTTQTFGFIREKTWMDNEQPFTPQSIPAGSLGTVSINTFNSKYFPGVSIYNVYGGYQPAGTSSAILNIGPNAEGQSPNTGVFQNRFQPSANAIWTLGKHTVTFGGSYSNTQLNTIDHRTGTGTVATDDFSAFAQGYVTPGSASTGFYVTSFLQGNANRYYRANQVGTYVQDKFQVTPTLSLTAGLRYDWDGGLSEKYGRLFNFDPSLYSYNSGSDTITNPGFIIAGNNTNGTSGVSNTTLTGRQWGIGPRVGAAWQPEVFHNKLVVRSGFGMYYDRGELFTYFSPGYAIGTVTGGPFGVNQQLPFVTSSTCTQGSLYSYYIPTCGGGGGYGPPVAPPDPVNGNLENPYGQAISNPVSTSPKASDLAKYLPNLDAISNGGQPISLGVYDRKNKLPYTYNYTLDIQWQPRNDLAIDIGYVGNLGRHQVIPVPFNQPGLANASAPIHGEIYSYGYNVGGVNLPNGQPYDADYEGGNVDHRVPYVGYAAESISYKAAGVDQYNALNAHVEKRMSHGVQVGASYTYSHALDEQSGLGLFYNGNNPLNLRDGYASADFDRTHVLNFNYVFRAPDLIHDNSFGRYFANGWSLVGLTVLQSGQPYSVIDFSGAVGSIYYSTSDGITNPIVPLASGCTPKSARTGLSGAFGDTALKASCFTLPLLTPNSSNGIPSNDPYETGFTKGQRNIFKQAFQRRADASIVKETRFGDRYNLRYTFDVYNLTNSASFDVPGNEVSQNAGYNAFPAAGQTPLPTGCNAQGQQTNTSFYNCPGGLGIVSHTIGSPRQIQMSLSFMF